MNEIQTTVIDTLTVEILVLKQQTAQSIIEIGKRLITVKESLPHGEWGKYLEEKVDFSQPTANRFMKVANEFSNSSTLMNLSQSKVFALLSLPQEERETFVKENPVNEMTTRELQKVIKEKQDLEAKLKDSIEFNKKAHELASLRTEERNIALNESGKLKNALQIEKDNLKKEKENSKKEIAELQSFIGEAKATGDDEEVERLQASLKEIQVDLDSSAQKIDQLETQLREKPIDVTETIIEKVPEEVEKELQELRKKDSQNSDQSVVKFKIYYENLQSTFTSQLELIDEIKDTNPENHEKFKNAISKLLSKMAERL